MAIQAQFPLHNSQDLMENTYLFCNQQKQQQQCFIEPNRGFHFETSMDNHCKSQSMALYDDVKQSQELDHLLNLQNERLRVLLQEQKRSLLALILKGVEAKVMPLMRQKEEEISKASKRNMELEEFMRRLEMENHIWQKVAQDNEAMITSLNTTIDQLKQKSPLTSPNNEGVNDAESCCDDEEEYRGNDEDGNVEMKKMMMCKVCNSRKVCVLFLPCRHLCSCKSCEALIDSCPVCQSQKKASIEALIV